MSLVLIRFPRTLPISIVKKRLSCAIAPVSWAELLPDSSRSKASRPCLSSAAETNKAHARSTAALAQAKKLNVRSGVEASDYPVALSYRFSTCVSFRPTRCSVKEVIQPQVPLRLPCYDFAPVTALALGGLAPCGFRHRLRALTASMA